MDDPPVHSRFMDHLLFRVLKGDSDPAEERKVLEWRASSPEHEAYCRELEALLEATRGAYALPRGRRRPSADDLVRLPAGGGRAARTPPRRPRAAWRLRVGLLAAGAAAGALLLNELRPVLSARTDFPGLGADEFVTGSTDVATVQLRDGTVVRLAPQSRLRIGGSRSERTVTLDGRAFFAVSRVEGRPFIVRTAGGDAVVLGTRFEAEARGSELRLLVIEGSVALSASGSHLEVAAGQMAVAVEGAVSTPTPVVDPEDALGWMGDFLVFQQTPIGEVAHELGKRFAIDVRVIGAGSGSHTVTAWFSEPTAEDVLWVVCKVLAARCTIEHDEAMVDLTSGDPAAGVVP